MELNITNKVSECNLVKMTVISREIFYKIITNHDCGTVVHPHLKRCIPSMVYIMKESCKGSFKFFIPIYTLELIMKNKKINKPFLKKMGMNFLKSYIYGNLMANLFFISSCGCRHIIGKYYYFTAVLIPGFISGFSIFAENPQMKILDTILFFSICCETLILYGTGEKLIRRSKNKDVFFSMLVNGLFMYLLKNNPSASKSTLLWFFDPRPAEKITDTENKNQNSVEFKKSCSKYFIVGYAFQVIKSSLSKFSTIFKKPFNIVPLLFNKKSLQAGIFFGTYVLIYKVALEKLKTAKGKESKYDSALAGFLSGLSYYFNNNLQMNVMPITLSLQILWLDFKKKYNLPPFFYTELLFAFCCAFIFHVMFFCEDYCTKYVKNMIFTATNGASTKFLDSFINFCRERMIVNNLL